MKWWVILIGVLIALGWGTMSQLEASEVKYGTPMGVLTISTTIRWILIGVLCLVLFLVPSTKSKVECGSTKCWAVSIGIGILGTATAIAYMFLLQRTKASVLLSFVYPLSLLCTVFIGKVFMKDRLTVTQCVGIGFAMLAAVLLALNGHQTQTTSQDFVAMQEP